MKTQQNTAPVPPEPTAEGEERNVNFEEALEAVLFAAGHPISYSALGRVFNMTPAQVKDRVFEYAVHYNSMQQIRRGVILLTYADSCQLCTKQYYLPEIRDVLGIKKSGTLSTSSMEALAIVAYNQPVTRVFVDTLRRADSSYAMNNLLDRGLIECRGRLDVPGRPMLYGTTNDFLRCFGLDDLCALPETSEELINLFAKTKNVADNDAGTEEPQQTETQHSAQHPETGESDLHTANEEIPIEEQFSAEDDMISDFDEGTVSLSEPDSSATDVSDEEEEEEEEEDYDEENDPDEIFDDDEEEDVLEEDDEEPQDD